MPRKQWQYPQRAAPVTVPAAVPAVPEIIAPEPASLVRHRAARLTAIAAVAAMPSFFFTAPAPTRFYLPSTGNAAVSPAFNPLWSDSTAGDRRRMVTTRINTAMAVKSIVDRAEADRSYLWRQYVSDPIKAQTIAGLVKGQLRCREETSDDNHDRPLLAIKVVSGDGGTVRGTLLALAHAGYGSTLEYSVLPTSTNRKLADGDALSSVIALAGDRIVVEIGTLPSTAPGTIDSTIAATFGDNSATDLPEDESTTATNNPWIEFSQSIRFETPEPLNQNPVGMSRKRQATNPGPSFFFDPSPPFFTGQPDVQINQPPVRPRDRRYLAPSFFSQIRLDADAPVTLAPLQTEQPRARVPSRAHLGPSFFFGDPPRVPQVFDAVSQPRGTPDRIRLERFLVFEPPAPFTGQPFVEVSRPIARPSGRAYLAPSFFFDPRPLFFTGQPLAQISEPQPQKLKRAHLAPFFFFAPQPFAFTDQPLSQISEPQPERLPTAHLVPGFFFDPRPLFFTGQPEGQAPALLARREGRAHLGPALFFEPPIFAGQPLVEIPDRVPRSIRRDYLAPPFFFETVFAPALVEVQTAQPRRVVASRSYLERGFFFDPQPIVFTDQVFVPIVQPPARFVDRRFLRESFFFRETFPGISLVCELDLELVTLELVDLRFDSLESMDLENPSLETVDIRFDMIEPMDAELASRDDLDLGVCD